MTIDDLRNSALTITLDKKFGHSQEFVSGRENLYVITNSHVVNVKTADETDPERTNINIPNSYQAYIIGGSDNEIIGRVLLTANKFCQKVYLGDEAKCKNLIDLAFDISKLLVEADQIQEVLLSKIDESQQGSAKVQNDGAIHIPHIPNLNTECDSFIRKADLIRDKILKIFEAFYFNKSQNQKKRMENLDKNIKEISGKDSEIYKLFKCECYFLSFLRNLRNKLEHPSDSEYTKIEDFTIMPAGDMHPPSIELTHKETPQSKVGINLLLPLISSRLIDAAELLIAFICTDNTTSNFVAGVMELPEERRKNKFVRLSYSTMDSKGNHMPLG